MCRRIKRASYIIALLILMSGCTQKISRGEVIEKEFVPAHTSMMIIPVVRTNGKTTSTTMIPYVYYYADRYTIKIAGYDKDGEHCSAAYRVTKEVFDAVELGAEFEYVKEMKPDYPEYTRERQSNNSQQ